MHRNKVKLRRRLRAEVDPRAGARGELVMTGDEIGVTMCFDHMFDRETVSARIFEVDIDVPLRIDNGGFGTGPNEI